MNKKSVAAVSNSATTISFRDIEDVIDREETQTLVFDLKIENARREKSCSRPNKESETLPQTIPVHREPIEANKGDRERQVSEPTLTQIACEVAPGHEKPRAKTLKQGLCVTNVKVQLHYFPEMRVWPTAIMGPTKTVVWARRASR